MSFTNRVEAAYKNNVITSEQVIEVIKILPCYSLYALRPGNKDQRCEEARQIINLPKITGIHPELPNADRVFPDVCKKCPVFALAYQQMVASLPKR